jgi:hypothetical protein
MLPFIFRSRKWALPFRFSDFFCKVSIRDYGRRNTIPHIANSFLEMSQSFQNFASSDQPSKV